MDKTPDQIVSDDLTTRFGDGAFRDFASALSRSLANKPSRERSLMLTKLEEAQDWYVRASRV